MKMAKKRDDVRKTFDDWGKAGYRIKRGEKSISRNSEGVCLFRFNQTRVKPTDKFDRISYADLDLERDYVDYSVQEDIGFCDIC
tara:strand:+ start:6550 stop:6801 length:252 start_codon:yes stop_codon:yes gene_type:complete